MTAGLPASGVISIGNISVEILRASTATTTMNDTNVRTLLGRPTDASIIYMSDAYSKRWVTPGSQSITAVGTTNFTVPRYETLTVTVKAGGAGATGYCGNDGFAHGYCGGAGAAGGNSNFASGTAVTAYGGGGTSAGSNDYCPPSGANSGGVGGTVTTGGGGVGGTGCNRGGFGGMVVKTWNWADAGAPAYGAVIAATIGGGGAGGGGGEAAGAASAGAAGSVVISWT